jgi:hypothetical protein
MEPGEILAPKSLSFQDRNRESVAEGESCRSACCRGEIMRTCLLLHPTIENRVALATESRVDNSGQRNRARPETAQVFE